MLLCGYSGNTWFIILGMILTGAARSIVVKLSYQSGFEAPLTITLLYLLGQSFSLFLYGFQKFVVSSGGGNNHDFVRSSSKSTAIKKEGFQNEWLHGPSSVELGSNYYIRHDAPPIIISPISNDKHEEQQPPQNSSIILPSSSTLSSTYGRKHTINDPSYNNDPTSNDNANDTSFYWDGINPSSTNPSSTTGSTHGLTKHSAQTIQWAHTVPFYAKPAIPALLNMLNSALRWASLVYIDASVAEMMISGLELTLSVVAARVFRKRMVSRSRWVGVIIVAFGVTIIEHANSNKQSTLENEDETDDGDGSEGINSASQSQEVMVGVVLIVLQSILSVLQDIGEEIFMQATDFPPTMMLGLEGLYGFCVGLIVYLTFGDHFVIENVSSTKSMLENNPKLRWWLVGLPLLFLITGYFNIKATEVTSAMTRNVWKNMRTVLVWVIALGIYYLGNGSYGEAWLIPQSFMILFGFLVMCTGIICYYWFKDQEKKKSVPSSGNDELSPQARILS